MTARHILLTGATGGIGRATARALVDAGHRVILTGRNENALQQLARQLGERARAVSADICSASGRDALAKACHEIDTLINNAGINDFGLFDDCHSVESQITTNLVAPMLLTQALLPVLKTRTDARIINIGSTLGSIGYPGYTTYCASKFGLRGFTEALERELADTSVRVQYIAPRATDTDINTDTIRQMNNELGSHTDSAETVAASIVSALEDGRPRTYIGWPEKLFVRINALLPDVVGSSLKKQLPIIKRYARSGQSHGSR
ncbi:MAG: SDR family oxidoreductase [Gammaproteobacteria bacterium]|nr:MAG: SDR family oxidoreductase [Gammaproteobacteria bacterium]